MTSVWDRYPEDYRNKEVQQILRAARAGECTSVIGLSGSGKSNLLGFLANCWPLVGELDDLIFIFVDCNRFSNAGPADVFETLTKFVLESNDSISQELSLEGAIGEILDSTSKNVCIMFDRFEILQDADNPIIFNQLRALRDAYKYRLVYLLAGRKPLGDDNELAELFFANTIWLGPLDHSDAEWNVSRYADRIGAMWDDKVSSNLIEISGGYPSILRGVCEAYASLNTLDRQVLVSHPAVQRRVQEFWRDCPTPEALQQSKLSDHPILSLHRPLEIDTSVLTAKEHALLLYLMEHSEQVCEKDDLIRAVWPEDAVFEEGIRDESLAQLVRRLRKKIEREPSNPRYIHTVPGRGYRFEM